MKRAEYLVNLAREVSREGLNPNGTASILDSTVIQYLNEAQERIYALISASKNVQKPFFRSYQTNVIANQAVYTVPYRIPMGNRYHYIERSPDSDPRNFVRIDKLQLFNNANYPSNFQDGYIIFNNQIQLVPPPVDSLGMIRIWFEEQANTLDIRRGQIDTVNGLTSTGFTSVVLDTTADSYETSVPGYAGALPIDYICIVDSDGNTKARNIPVGTYDTVTNTLTPRAGFTFFTGDTIAVGDYVTFNKYSSTHSTLPDMCEPYLIQYAANRMMGQNSSDDAELQRTNLEQIGNHIISQLRAQTSEVQFIPEYDPYGFY